MQAHGRQVDSRQPPVQLLDTKRDHLGILWPFEAACFQSLDHQPEARAFPQQYLDPVAPPVTEDEQGMVQTGPVPGLAQPVRPVR